MPLAQWVRDVRQIIGTGLLVNVGAAAAVINDHNQVLLQQRADNGKWGLPGGGIDPGEEPAQAAVREVYEETGLQVEATQLLGVFGGKDHYVTYADGNQVVYVSITFLCRVVGGTIQPDPDETLAAAWFPLDDLPATLMPKHHRRIRAYQAHTMPYYETCSHFESPAISYITQIRRQIGTRLLMLPACNAVIFNDEGHILLQQRSDNKQWNLPGGIYEPGEEPAQTMMREVYEETGLLVRPQHLVGVYGGEDFVVTYPHGDVVAYIAILFTAEVRAGELTMDDESLALAYFPPDQLPEPFSAIGYRFVTHAMQGQKGYFVR